MARRSPIQWCVRLRVELVGQRQHSDVRLVVEVAAVGVRGSGEDGEMDDAVANYIDAIDPEFRPLFDRVHDLVLGLYQDADIVLSYGIPTYRVGRGRLHVGGWRHGVSLYGWGQDAVAEFMARHPELRTSKGTIQLRPDDAAAIADDELRELIRAALDR